MLRKRPALRPGAALAALLAALGSVQVLQAAFVLGSRSALPRLSSRLAGQATPGERAAKLAKNSKDLPPPKRGILLEDVNLRYSRSSGPGGQNVNKVETRVQASFDVEAASFLPKWVKENLKKQEAPRFNKQGLLMVDCEEQRTRQDNTRIVMQKLQTMIDKAALKPKMPAKAKQDKMKRIKKAANEKRLQDKKLKSQALRKMRERRNMDRY